jgi:hypothetical protein
LNDSSTKINIIIIEESNEWADLNVLDANSRQHDVVILVRGQRILVLLEQLDDFLVELVENGISYSDLSQFKNRRCVVIDVLSLRSVAEKLTSDSLETAIVPEI